MADDPRHDLTDNDAAQETTAGGRFVRVLTSVLGAVQLLLGAIGFLGVYLYLIEPTNNPSRYQLLFLPAWALFFALPLLILSTVLYRRCGPGLTQGERWLLNLGCASPLVAFAAALIASWVSH